MNPVNGNIKFNLLFWLLWPLVISKYANIEPAKSSQPLVGKRKNAPDIIFGWVAYWVPHTAKPKLIKKTIDNKINIVLIPNRQVSIKNIGNNI